MLKAISFDYWDTLYDGELRPERAQFRQRAIRRMLAAIGREMSEPEFERLYHASGAAAERWWRVEQRGYTAADRIRWMLQRLELERPDDCEHLSAAVAAVDDALTLHPAPLLSGADEMLRAVAPHFRFAIVSDTGFSSGVAQDRLLERDGLLRLFPVRVYSCDVGHAKPHPETFQRALAGLGLRPEEVLHVGDSERTDVQGALAVGMRAIRFDAVRRGGPREAEYVAENYEELTEYLLEELE